MDARSSHRTGESDRSSGPLKAFRELLEESGPDETNAGINGGRSASEQPWHSEGTTKSTPSACAQNLTQWTMLMELLSKAATIALLSFVVSSMLAMGRGLTVAQIVEPLRSARLVVFSLFANFVLMPLVAFALAKVLWLDEPFAIGLLLLGCAAGAPFLPKLAELAKGNLAFAVGAMVVFMAVTVIYLPIVLPLVLPSCDGRPVEDCSLPRPVHDAAARRWACPEGGLQGPGRMGQACA